MGPTCIIFRIKSDDGVPTFVEIPFIDGELSTHGSKFTVEEGDSYLKLTPSQVMFARKTQNNKSVELGSFTITSFDAREADVESIPYDDLKQVVDFALSKSSFTTVH